jgi:hypothetical protein
MAAADDDDVVPIHAAFVSIHSSLVNGL